MSRAYEHGWGVEKNHGKAVEIIRETENYPKDGTFRLNSDLIKNAYKEITGTEFPDSESSKQKEKQAISDAWKSQNEQPQSDINFKRLEIDSGDVFEGYFLNKKSKAAENTSGQTAISLTVTGWMASAPAKEESHGQTERHLTVNGRTIRCPKENTPSQTEKYMTAAFRTARRRATASVRDALFGILQTQKAEDRSTFTRTASGSKAVFRMTKV